jgi:hypothetical protein
MSRIFKELAMLVDAKLDAARAALIALGDLACCMDETSDCPSDEFGFGLSILLRHVANDLKETKNELYQYMETVRQRNTGGGTA